MASYQAKRPILALYRSCMRSVKRIPDLSQRAVYNIYLRDSFKRKRSLVPSSREAKMAIDDAVEQLDRMNFYHSIREEKERKDCSNTTAQKHTIMSTSSERINLVEEWLMEALPQLHTDDLKTYASVLVEDGFDSKELLETELLAEDLVFMKKAHRRLLIRKKNLGP
eukprot:scaffold26888_cov137-Cylindrotheca_fusiformis.AAC.4